MVHRPLNPRSVAAEERSLATPGSGIGRRFRWVLRGRSPDWWISASPTPSQSKMDSGCCCCREAPHSQWRARSGVAPDSLFSPIWGTTRYSVSDERLSRAGQWVNQDLAEEIAKAGFEWQYVVQLVECFRGCSAVPSLCQGEGWDGVALTGRRSNPNRPAEPSNLMIFIPAINHLAGGN